MMKLQKKLHTYLVSTTTDIESIRNTLFIIVLAVSVFASLCITLGSTDAFIASANSILVKSIMAVWIVFHIPLLFLSRTAKKNAVYTFFCYMAFLLITFMFNLTVLSDFNAFMLQMPEICALIFLALLLLSFTQFTIYSTIICIVSALHVMVRHDLMLPPFGNGTAVVILTQIGGIWLLGIFVSGILVVHYRKLLASRMELSHYNDKLEKEIAATVVKMKSQQEQLYQSQKLESLGEMAGGIAHDLNNYVTAILGFGKFALKKLEKNSPVIHYVDQIMSAGNKITALISKLLLFSRKQQMSVTEVNVNTVIKGLNAMLHQLVGAEHTVLIQPADNLDVIMANEVNIEQVLVNLTVNARDALTKEGTIVISTTNVKITSDCTDIPGNGSPGDFVRLSVADNGCGISPEVQKKIFEPFFTTKPLGKGTGLGLSVVYGIVLDHHGWIDCASEVGKGTTFSIYFPAMATAVSPERDNIQSSVSPQHSPGEGKYILVVDDQSELLDICVSMLNDNGYHASGTGDAESALALLEKEPRRYHALLSDIMLPGMSGIDLVKIVKERFPEIDCMLISGCPEKIKAYGILPCDEIPFISKPFTAEELLSTVSHTITPSKKATDRSTPTVQHDSDRLTL